MLDIIPIERESFDCRYGYGDQTLVHYQDKHRNILQNQLQKFHKNQ